jgi:ATP-dependent metalloprotease FtsH
MFIRLFSKNILENNIDKKTNNIKINDVVGLKSVKQEMEYYFDFLKNSEKYKDWNVKIPKGVLLIGPPGTGKTLLVKALANQSNIPIETVSGSDFVEMFVGMGASRVRSLFKKARMHKKCIIFIDEIDAIGKNRNISENSERDQTLNQLLVEMDGFNQDSEIMVFAATNMTKNLDPALLRSGRFDKKIYFDPPNKDERNDLFKLYIDENKVSSNNISELIQNLSDYTASLTGADIANICNQAKINAIQNNNEKIKFNDFKKSIDEIMIGREKPERKMNNYELERVSCHESGHALMAFLLKECDPPIKISILPRGENALGFSQQKPNEIKLYTQNYILNQIAVLLGGRIAEKIIYDNYSSGAADDIEKITKLTQSYLLKYGMHEDYGPINYEILQKESGKEIQYEIKKLVNKIEKFTYNTLLSNIDDLKKMANLLREKETIETNDILSVWNKENENKLTITI